jgi:hypothetical protein
LAARRHIGTQPIQKLDGMFSSRETSAPGALRTVKIVHTLAWAVFAGSIVALPMVAWRGQFTVAAILIALVTVEVLVLLANRFRCPLTDVAARYTSDRRDNFDIYLPLWVARYNKHIFGPLFVAGVLFTIIMWQGT